MGSIDHSNIPCFGDRHYYMGVKALSVRICSMISQAISLDGPQVAITGTKFQIMKALAESKMESTLHHSDCKIAY